MDLLQHRMGLSGPVLNWFASFLCNRTQRIKVKRALASSTPVLIGVPQGSTLSPTLFNLFMEPLAVILNRANIQYHMYADDTQLYLKISSQEDIKTLNAALAQTQQWLAQNHLLLNTLKTEFLFITPPNHSAPTLDWIKQQTALNCTPHVVDSAKSLGVTLDKHLNMQAHISATTRGANYQLNMLKKIKPFLPPEDLRTAVQSLIIPRLKYGLVTLAGLPKASLAPLRATLNASARLLTGSRKFDHISPDLL